MDLKTYGLGLSDALETLREELALSAQKGRGKPLRFRIQDVKLELSLVATSQKKIGGGIKWYVLSAEATGDISDAVTQKITLTLEVKDAGTNQLAEIEGTESAPGV